MTDQCNHCSYKGDLAACKAAECSKHKDWYPMQLQKELGELKASIKGMVKHAHECEDHFCGGYRDKKELDAFVHGMRTVAHCVEGYANQLEGKE